MLLHPCGRACTRWEALNHVDQVGLETAEFFSQKTKYAVSIMQTYENFRSSVYALTPAINQMMVGNRSKQTSQELGRMTLETQEICKLAIESYF